MDIDQVGFVCPDDDSNDVVSSASPGSSTNPTFQCSLKTRLRKFAAGITVEPATCLFMVALGLEMPVTQMWQSVVTSVLAVCISLVMGLWSDVSKRRKPLLLAPTFGYAVSQGINLVMATGKFDDGRRLIPPEWFMLTAVVVPVLGFGGMTTFIAGQFALISDSSSHGSRTARVAIIDTVLFLSLPIGTMISGYLYDYYGYPAVYISTMALFVLTAFYITFGITEPDKRPAADDDSRPILNEPPEEAPTSLTVGNFKRLFRPRPGQMRRTILCLITAMILNMSLFYSGSISFLYTRLNLHWQLTQYTTWSSFATAFSGISSLVFVSCCSSISWPRRTRTSEMVQSDRYLGKDIVLGLIGATSGMLGYTVVGLASETWMMYISSIVGCLSASTPMVIRSMLSKSVDPSELGRLFAVVASLESATPLLFSPIYTSIYEATLAIGHTEIVFFVFAAIYGVNVFIIAFTRRTIRNLSRTHPNTVQS